MIYTVTLNPAIDKTITDSETRIDIGGKGINVSKVLKNLGTQSVAMGLVGKENKDLIYSYLEKKGIPYDFVETEGRVRTNTKHIVQNKLIEENEKGPDCDLNSYLLLQEKLNQLHDEIVVLSGSAPKNLGFHVYYELVTLLKKNKNYVLLDCDKQLLSEGIKAHPDVIKPNQNEIEFLMKEPFDETKMIHKVKEFGIDLIVISLGDKGAYFVSKQSVQCNGLKVNYSSPVGAGDSMVAAIAYSKERNFNFMDMVKLAMATSAAAVETKGTNPPLKGKIDYYKDKVEISGI